MKEGKKKDVRARRWMITLPEYAMELDELKQVLTDGNFRWAFQLEQGKDGYKHYQIYCEADNPRRFSAMKKLFGPKCHLESARSKQDVCMRYVSKLDSALGALDGELVLFADHTEAERLFFCSDDTWFAAASKGQTEPLVDRVFQAFDQGMSPHEVVVNIPGAEFKSNQIHALYADYVHVTNKRFRTELRLDLTCTWIDGPTGCGKSRHAWQKYGPDAFWVNDYRRDPWGKYACQPAVVLDEFTGQFPVTEMLRLCDIYPYELQARYRNKLACYTELFCLSNMTFSKVFSHADKAHFLALRRRFKAFYHMDKNGTLHEYVPEWSPPYVE